MSRFYMTSVNSRGNTVSAMGSPRGQDCHLRGWNSGVEVVAHPSTADLDTFLIYATHGSNGNGRRHLLGSVYADQDGHLHFSLEVQPGNDLQLD